MSTVALQSRLTPEEYLTLERKVTTKSEYLSGHIYAMAGASREHNLITGNIFGELRSQLRDQPCEAYVNDMRLKISPTGLYTYPDVAIVCDEPRFKDTHFDTLLNTSGRSPYHATLTGLTPEQASQLLMPTIPNSG